MCMKCISIVVISLFVMWVPSPSWGGAMKPLETVPQELGFYSMSGLEDLRPGGHMHDQHRPPPRPDFHGVGQVQHAGVSRDLAVMTVPLPNSDHELMFNVTWTPPNDQQLLLTTIPIWLGRYLLIADIFIRTVNDTWPYTSDHPAKDYSLEVRSVTLTSDCDTPMCYEYNIPGDATWWTIPQRASPVAGGCAVHPGCAYTVRLIAHPWDGHTSANINVELDECVSDVCSCAHAGYIPAPTVHASTVSLQGGMFANVTWTLPEPTAPQRLPRGLGKKTYLVSIGKQMVSDAHPAPWYAHAVTRRVDTSGPVFSGEAERWLLLPISDKSVGRSGKRNRLLDVRLLARVSLLDDRECMGPAGNATAYDPVHSKRRPITAYALWAAFGGTCMLSMVVVVAIGTRGVKRMLRALRPATASAPLEPLCRRPAWLPLQLRPFDEVVTPQGVAETNPLYTPKEFEGKPPEDDPPGDQWEVVRSRVHLMALIGTGAFGRVHAAQLDMPGGETLVVAAKMLSDNATEEETQDFLGEIAMLKHVGYHKHVIRLIGCCINQRPLIALLEHAPRGDLLTLLRTARGRTRGREQRVAVAAGDAVEGRPSEADTEYTTLSDSDPSLAGSKLSATSTASCRDHYVAEPALHLDSSTMRDYALQVALGMQHLEQRGITHRDLAARNILVDGTGTLKVADFGLSRSGIYVHTKSKPVPLRWLAPEAIIHSQYSTASDVWAFAVLLWEIATLGGFPYSELSNHQVPAFLAGGSRLPRPARASASLYLLMEHCWAEDPLHRPTFTDIVHKLTIQQQLYIDLDSVFPPIEEDPPNFCDNEHEQ